MAQDLATLLGMGSLGGGPTPNPPQPAGPYQTPTPTMPGAGMPGANPTMPPPPVPNANPMGIAPGNQLGGLMPPQAQGQGQQGQIPMPLLLQLLNLIGSKANPRGQQMDQYTPITNIGIRG